MRMISGPPSGKNVERGTSIRPVRNIVSSITNECRERRVGWCWPFRGAGDSSPQELLHRGIRIEGAFRHARDRGGKTRFADAALELAQQSLAQERFDLGPGRAAPP